jgi:hypothetical protein
MSAPDAGGKWSTWTLFFLSTAPTERGTFACQYAGVPWKTPVPRGLRTISNSAGEMRSETSVATVGHLETTDRYQVVFVSCIHFARLYMVIARARIRCARLPILVASVLLGSMRRIRLFNSEMKAGGRVLTGMPV